MVRTLDEAFIGSLSCECRAPAQTSQSPQQVGKSTNRMKGSGTVSGGALGWADRRFQSVILRLHHPDPPSPTPPSSSHVGVEMSAAVNSSTPVLEVPGPEHVSDQVLSATPGPGFGKFSVYFSLMVKLCLDH